MGKDGFSEVSYLARLSMRMSKSRAALDAGFRARQARAIMPFRRDGGFAGRRGGADLYYTAFAVRALHALGELNDELAGGVRSYVNHRKCESIIDELSRLNSLLLAGTDGLNTEGVLEFIETFRAKDGGYAKAGCRGVRVGADPGSTYHTFLAVLCHDLFGRRIPRPDDAAQFLLGRRRDDGGFCESPSARHGNTNATAAGVSALMLLGAAGGAWMNGARDYLLGMRHDLGGWLAAKHAPFPDLLSTFTALLTLDGMSALDVDTLARAVCFAKSCEAATGGFTAGPWDDQVDVEYTYYGLGVLSLAIEKT